MATKRQAPSDSDARQNPSKRTKSTPYQHQQRPAHHGKKSFKKAHPVNELKSAVRSLRRLLENNDELPANVRVEKERALQNTERDLKEAQRAKKRSDLIGRYHKVRFFERQKAERRLKKARREVKEQGDGEGGELRKKVEEAEVDLNYANYFPLEREYVSLWPRKKEDEVEDDGEGKEGERQGDSEMLEVVRRCMREGTLRDLREGRLSQKGDVVQDEEESAPRPAKKKTKREKPGKAASTKRVQEDEQDSGDDETGGGFFE